MTTLVCGKVRRRTVKYHPVFKLPKQNDSDGIEMPLRGADHHPPTGRQQDADVLIVNTAAFRSGQEKVHGVLRRAWAGASASTRSGGGRLFGAQRNGAGSARPCRRRSAGDTRRDDAGIDYCVRRQQRRWLERYALLGDAGGRCRVARRRARLAGRPDDRAHCVAKFRPPVTAGSVFEDPMAATRRAPSRTILPFIQTQPPAGGHRRRGSRWSTTVREAGRRCAGHNRTTAATGRAQQPARACSAICNRTDDRLKRVAHTLTPGHVKDELVEMAGQV